MFPCRKCGIEFSRSNNRQRHEGICNGLLKMQCPGCLEIFPDRRSKYRHKSRCPGFRASEVQQPMVINDNCTTNVFNIGVATTAPSLVRDPYADVLDFGDTSVQAVIDFIVSDQAAQGRLLKAFDCGCLHEELTRLTHFFGPPENRNVLSIEPRGVTMKVVVEKEAIKMNSAQGIAAIASRNARLSNTPELKRIIGVEDDGDVLTDSMTTRQKAHDSLAIRLVIENGGKYVFPERIVVEPLVRVSRRQLSQRVRYGIAAGQGWQCNVCNDLLTTCFDVDHVVPLCRGGADETWNMQALCVPCHRQKTVDERTR